MGSNPRRLTGARADRPDFAECAGAVDTTTASIH
jgi:hypothetical protein